MTQADWATPCGPGAVVGVSAPVVIASGAVIRNQSVQRDSSRQCWVSVLPIAFARSPLSEVRTPRCSLGASPYLQVRGEHQLSAGFSAGTMCRPAVSACSPRYNAASADRRRTDENRISVSNSGGMASKQAPCVMR
jgi:hypothetical protein